MAQPLWKCTPVQLVLRQSSFRLVFPFLGRCVLNCRGFFCWNSCANWCQDKIKISGKIYTRASVKLRSSKSALGSKTGVSEVYSYNNWAMCCSFLLKQSARSLIGKEEARIFYSSSSNMLKFSTSWSSLSLSLHPCSLKSQREQEIESVVREVLRRGLYVLRNGI